jgi:hypothetical protein
MRLLDSALCGALCCLLVACGGGGGGSDSGGNGGTGNGGTTNPPPPPASSASIALDKTSLSYAAGYPGLPAPRSQVVNATVTGALSGTLYILITITGNAVVSAPPVVITGPTTGRATINVPPPATLGTGTYRSTLQVRACVNDQTCATGQLQGSPQNIEVTYTIGSATPADAVMPRVVTVGEDGEVVLRGSLAGASTVAFGSTLATVVSVDSDTQLRAIYPALPAGTYPVRINGGSVPFTGSLVVVGSPAFTKQTLAYPRANGRVGRVVFDAERNALLVATHFDGQQTDNGELWRYTFDGSTWSAPTVVPVPGLEDITFSPNGSRLIAATETGILELDPANLTTLRTVPAPTQAVFDTEEPVRLHSIAFANDGTAIVSSHPNGVVGDSPLFYYYPSVAAFREGDHVFSHPSGSYPTLSASGDGSRVLIGLGGISTPEFLKQYQTQSRAIVPTSVAKNIADRQPLAVDRLANHIGVLNVFDATIYDANFSTLGALPVVPSQLTVNPAGTRAIALDGDNVRTFDMTTAPFTEIGSPISIGATGMGGSMTAITPDGKTVFYAGTQLLVVMPLP